MRRFLAILLFGSAACGSHVSNEELEARMPEPPARPKTARGARAIDIDWDPNGLAWDVGERALYAVDQTGNRLMRWTDRRGFQVAAALPKGKGAGRPALGGVARLADGRTLVARSGSGEDGTLILLSEVRGAETLADLPGDRRRAGVAVAPSGAIYVVSSSGGKGRTRGHLSRINLDEASETDLSVDELERPVGVAVVGDVLYVSDQARGEIVALSLDPPGSAHPVAQLKSPDMMAPGPTGSLLVASKTGAVWQFTAGDGRLTRLLTSRSEVRGIAYDPVGKRMFFVEHDPDPSDGVEHRLQIVPLR